MRRPLPPELVTLGDQLELAAARALGRRRTRRQMVLNALTSLAVALPLVAGALGTISAPAPVDQPVRIAPSRPNFARAADDFPPRVLQHSNPAAGDVLVEPTTLRRALR